MVWVQQERKSVLYSSHAAQLRRLQVSWGWSASVHVLFSILAPLQSLYEQSPGREYPSYGGGGVRQEKSFQELKQQLASVLVLAYFDKDAHTRVIADASPVGLGEVLGEKC